MAATSRKYFKLNESIFNQIVRLLDTEKVSNISHIIGISTSRIYEIKKYTETNDEPTFLNFMSKKGRPQIQKNDLEAKVCEIFGQDNSLTQKDAKEILSNFGINLSKSELSRIVKSSGLTRKRLKKKAAVTLNESHKQKKAFYASNLLGKRNYTLIFLDESGFNLHLSNSYGYSMADTDAVITVRPSRGQNISLCAMLAPTGICHYRIIDGPYNSVIFKELLEESIELNLFSENSLIIMDNVRFHHSSTIKNLLNDKNIGFMFLPAYSPELNPIENVFSALKSKVISYRPIPNSREIMKDAEILNFYC